MVLVIPQFMSFKPSFPPPTPKVPPQPSEFNPTLPLLAKMSVTSVIIHFGGVWMNESYQGGQKLMLLLSKDGICYANFLKKIQSNFGGVDVHSVKYVITCLVVSEPDECGSVRFNITDDVELKFAIDNSVRNFFVNVVPIMPSFQRLEPIPQNSETFHESNNVPHNDDILESDDQDDDYLPEDDASFDSLDNDEPFDYDPWYEDEGDPTMFHPLLHNMKIVPPISHTSPPRSKYDDRTLSTTTSSLKKSVFPHGMAQGCLLVDKPDFEMNYSPEPLSVGGTFDSKDSLKYAVGLYHLNNKCEFVVERSSPKNFYVVCKHRDRCQFHMRSTTSSVGSFWRITHWQAPHTCQIDLRVHNHRTMCSSVIGAFFAPRLLDHGAVLRPKEMASQLQREFGFKISYSVAWAGRNRAIQMIYGDSDNSFQLLPAYLHMIEVSNPGSFVALQTDSDNVFEYAFMALGACISGFVSSCRPVIVVDGTHLKGKYKGVMFVAASKDANEQIIPLAFGIGDKENDRSWIWFLSKVKEAFGVPNDLIIVSDQHLSIGKAVEVVFPGVVHGLCAFHIQKNLSKYGENVVKVFQRAVSCFRKEDFEKYMLLLEEIAPTTAFPRLNLIDRVRWANSYCPVRRYGVLTSNACENINSRLRWARTLPVCTLLECVRSMIGSWFVKRRLRALNRDHDLPPNVAAKLEKSIEDGCTMVVEPINSTKFSVNHSGKRYTVDLGMNSCSCREFDLNLIPCAHASAAISNSKQQTISYVSPFFTTKAWYTMYASDVSPTPNKDEWILPQHVKDRIVCVPSNPRQTGRPRMSRISSHAESSRFSNKKCSRCKRKGHYSSTCDVGVTISSTPSVTESRKRRPKACSICHETDHTKRKCPSYVKPGL